MSGTSIIAQIFVPLMQVRSIAECSKGEHSAILLTFINLPFVIKIFVLSGSFKRVYCLLQNT